MDAAFVPDVVERDAVFLRDGFEVVVVPDDDTDFGVELAPFVEEAAETVRFLRHEEGDLPGVAFRREANADVYPEVVAEFGEVAAESVFAHGHLARLDVNRHAEDALADGLVDVLDVDSALEEEGRDAGDESGIIVPDDGDFGQLSVVHRFTCRLRGTAMEETYRVSVAKTFVTVQNFPSTLTRSRVSLLENGSTTIVA